MENGELDYEIRPVRTHEEYAACVRLQRATWGEDFTECVPTAILKVSQRIGGVTAGAFGAHGRLLGMVFGMTGLEHGQPVHWSDILAVREEHRNRGIGRRLKEFQRDHCRRLGVRRIYWTYDPLVARNAHLNLNRLGARPVEYVTDMYGGTISPLHAGLGSDRFVVAWPIDGAEAPPAPSRERWDAAPLASAGDGPVEGPEAPPLVRVEIPADIHAISAASPAAAAEWRRVTRRAFQHWMQRGYRVGGFYRDEAAGRCFYVLAGD